MIFKIHRLPRPSKSPIVFLFIEASWFGTPSDLEGITLDHIFLLPRRNPLTSIGGLQTYPARRAAPCLTLRHSKPAAPRPQNPRTEPTQTTMNIHILFASLLCAVVMSPLHAVKVDGKWRIDKPFEISWFVRLLALRRAISIFGSKSREAGFTDLIC